MRRKRSVRWAFGLAVVAALFTSSQVLAQSYTPGNGITGTPHDFSGTPVPGAAPLTTGKCTFCHTPHRALQTRLLWNHTLSSATYDWSDTTTTMGGTTLQGFDSTWQGPSKFCLSCHDGSVAIGDIAWFNKTAWAGSPLDTRTMAADFPDSQIATATGDLAGNHPVAHPFPANATASLYNSVTTGTEAMPSGWVADPTVNGIRLFNDDGSGNISAGVVNGQTGIECSSCHDPHNGGGVQDVYFLRGQLGDGGNYICLKCHAK